MKLQIALHRYIAREGHINTIQFDKETNFVESVKKLAVLITKENKVADYFKTWKIE